MTQILVYGALTSVIYFALALGFSLIFGVARIANLAHTAFYMLASYILFTCGTLLGLNVLLSIFVALIGTILLGMFSYKLLLERIREHDIAVLMVTLALALIFQEFMLIIFGGYYQSVSPYLKGHMDLLGVTVMNQDLLIVVVVLACAGVILAFLYFTNLGLSMRATAQDREIANLMGINVDNMCLITMAIASGLAAVAGIVVAPTVVIEPYMWRSPLVMILAVVMLGGLGSIKGSFIGAVILAFAEVMIVFLVPGGSFIREAAAMVVMVIVLLVKPEGIFGVVFEEERL
jgi:branched-chain amino acid transport system permease protein